MKNGVPFEVIFDVKKLMPHERIAMGVVMSGFEGNVFDWDKMKFEEAE